MHQNSLIICLILAITVFADHIPIASAQQIEEELLLMASDGAPDDYFGQDVAVDGNWVLVGAYGDDDNGSFSGSAYLFDRQDGTKQHKLLPLDGGIGEVFGISVAIAGNDAFVGAFYNNDVGAVYQFDMTSGAQTAKLLPNDSLDVSDRYGWSLGAFENKLIVGRLFDNQNQAAGSAYVFNATTGQQISHLVPANAVYADEVGHSVAISGNIAIVGAPRDDDVSSDAGAAYLFDVTTGAETIKLLPSGGANELDFFGTSVAIAGNFAVVGAPNEDNNGIIAGGSAYVFDVTNGQQLYKLLPDVPVAFANFGRHVEIDGNRVIIGAYGDTSPHGSAAGSAYLFDAVTGEQLAKFYPESGAAGDRFGHSLGMQGDTIAVGAALGDGKVQNSGTAYIFSLASDADGDGLLDSWETVGLDINNDGTIDLDLPALGADPNHKDLFVEIDGMQGVSLDPIAIDFVKAAFLTAPVQNPDGTNGINLHIDLTTADTFPFEATWDDDFVAFQAIKSVFFGNQIERDSPNWEQIRIARKRAYRYCTIVNAFESDALGWGERPGNDFMCAFGGIAATDRRLQAITFMHELGHNLNLSHGGGDEINFKPNYVSAMNYAFDVYRYESGEPLIPDFSREVMAPLIEDNLDETIGIQSTEYNNVLAVHAYRIPGQSPQYAWVQLNSPNYDWNRDGDQQTGAVADLNWFGNGFPSPNDAPSPGQAMNSYNDWQLVLLPLGTEGPYADGQHIRPPHNPITENDIAFMRESVPPPPVNVADLTDVQIATGTLLAGDIHALRQTDQTNLQALSGYGLALEDLHQLKLTVRATSEVMNPAQLDVMVRSHVSDPGGFAELRLRNWKTGDMDLVGNYGLEIEQNADFFTGIDAADYIDIDGAIELSIQYVIQVPQLAYTFESFIDQVQITVR